MLSSLRATVSRALPRHVAHRVTPSPSFPFIRSQSTSIDDTMSMALQAMSSSPLPQATTPQQFSLTTIEDDKPKRVPIPLPRDPLLDYFTSALTRNGNRTRARALVTRTLLNIHTLTRAEALPILREAVLMASPAVKILNHKSRAGKPEPKPFALNDRQRAKFAFKWLLKETGKRKGPLPDRMAREVIDVILGKSNVLKSKSDLHRMAMLSRGNMGKS